LLAIDNRTSRDLGPDLVVDQALGRIEAHRRAMSAVPSVRDERHRASEHRGAHGGS
jgi:hypothetical protein